MSSPLKRGVPDTAAEDAPAPARRALDDSPLGELLRLVTFGTENCPHTALDYAVLAARPAAYPLVIPDDLPPQRTVDILRLAEASPDQPRKKMVVDTDIGTDPDDVLALMYAALSKLVDLMVVFTVTEDARSGRAALAALLLSKLGRRVHGNPLDLAAARSAWLEKGVTDRVRVVAGPRPTTDKPGGAAATVFISPEAAGLQEERAFEKMVGHGSTAVDRALLLRLAVQSLGPGETLTYLAIGPLTNLHQMMLAKEEGGDLILNDIVLGRIQFVAMCGKFPQGHEYNAKQDPAATAHVLLRVPVTLVPVNATTHEHVGYHLVEGPPEVCPVARRLRNLLHKTFPDEGVAELYEYQAKCFIDWAKERAGPNPPAGYVFGSAQHDVLALMVAIDPSLADFDTSPVVVSPTDGETAYATGAGEPVVPDGVPARPGTRVALATSGGGIRQLWALFGLLWQ